MMGNCARVHGYTALKSSRLESQPKIGVMEHLSRLKAGARKLGDLSAV
jgi:hypothetical protein